MKVLPRAALKMMHTTQSQKHRNGDWPEPTFTKSFLESKATEYD